MQAIHEESRFISAMPEWRDLVVNAAEIAALPLSWQAKLSQWRGVYHIYDTARRAGYVGSAYGADNILGRWRCYAETGHGGNKGLQESRPEDLRFSILQRTSPDLEAADIVALENGWKTRLMTRQYGLNEN